MSDNTKLFFGQGNAKLAKNITTFSLPAGWTCPGAAACLARADRHSGQLQDGAKQQFRCFSASAEAYSKTARRGRWHNFDLLKGLNQAAMASLIGESLPPDATIVRIHVSGDFFSEAYFLAWCEVATQKPNVRFYAYTKSVHFWLRNMQSVPTNLILTASEGGNFDASIGDLKRARVVWSVEEAAALGLSIDHDDTHAYSAEFWRQSFALLLHGTQAKGTPAAKALSALRLSGVRGYSKAARLSEGELENSQSVQAGCVQN